MQPFRLPILVAAPLLAAALGCSPGRIGAAGTPERAGAPAVLAPEASLKLHAEAGGGYASSVDERGVPTFLWSATAIAPPPGSTALAAARFHAARFATALALKPEALAFAAPSLVQDHGRRGIVVHLRQRVAGVEIYGRELRLLMHPDLTLVALSGALHPRPSPVESTAFRRSPEAALAAALSHAVAAPIPAAAVIDLHEQVGDAASYQLGAAGDVVVSDHAIVSKVLYPDGARLRPAYAIAFYVGHAAETDAAAWSYVVAADDGAVLERASLTQSDAFHYRVWADGPDKRPLDGPTVDYSPHPTGRPDWTTPAFVAPSLISMEGFNMNPSGAADPWLKPTDMNTAGNNVDAYTDRYPPEGLDPREFHATVTGPTTFDRTYDLNAPPTVSQAQTMAGIVQAFYDTNWLHDYWYDSGFNEIAGNAQKDNYRRGGAGNDRMQVQAQDNLSGGARDNSNMSTPPDGLSPRMQIYVWSGREARVLHTSPPDADQISNSAAFGPTHFDVEGVFSDIDDGTFPSVTDACDPIKNDITGKIALVDRGTCTFKRKSVNVETAGGIGIVIVNNVAGDPPGMANGDPVSTTLNIPVLSTSKVAGAKIRTAMANGPVTARLARSRDIDRDGTLDNSVLFHEWGHYLHHRLASCAFSKQCNAMSEGWADFNSLHNAVRDGEDLDGTYAVGIYASASFDDPGYFGIRRQPYTTDFRKNGLTFKHIADGEALPLRQPRNFGGGNNSEVHNAGEIWATMMWEAYVALQKVGRMRSPPLSFDEVRRRMADYVVLGHQMEPAEATYTESRDAVMAAAGASSVEDQLVIAEAFARRGAGTCADSPSRGSDTLQGVVEGFKVQPRLVIGDVTLDDASATLCTDMDGVLDSGERAKIVIQIANGALTPLSGASVDLTTSTAQASFTGPTHFDIPKLAALSGTQIMTEVALDPAMADPGSLVLKIAPSSNAACDNATREVSWKINYDIGKASTATDDVESTDTPWKATGDNAGDVWSRAEGDAGNHVWHGADTDSVYDTALMSPDLVVSPSAFFVMRFEYRHSFDSRDENGKRVYHDGGVIELSSDGGKTWQDVTKFANPGYGGTLVDGPPCMSSDDCPMECVKGACAINPLQKRDAFVDKNYSWPKFDHVTMNFLDTFAGQTVRLRFRIGTDDSGFDYGWDIDNLAFQGIDNLPFTGKIYDAGKCGTGPRGPAAHPSDGCTLSARAPSPPTPFALLLAALPLARLARRRRR